MKNPTVKQQIESILKQILDDNDEPVYISDKVYSDLENLIENNSGHCGCPYDMP